MNTLQKSNAMPNGTLTCLALFFLYLSLACAAESSIQLDDFEAPNSAAKWTFSNGPEFPGARGTFETTQDAAHSGKSGGRLDFDFAVGGNYVAAILKMPESAVISTNGFSWNAVRVWLKVPEGHDVNFRYTDSSGQNLSKTSVMPF